MLPSLSNIFTRLRPRTRPSTETLLARARTHAQAGRMPEALAIWRPLAEQGVARAQANLGACLANGEGLARDPVAASVWLERAAASGDTAGQRNFATLLLSEDPADSVAWYRRAAEQGDAISQDQLSRMLLDGNGTTPDLAGARHWATLAANQGIAGACARLGMMYHEAKGGPRDATLAAHWWRRAAEAGDGDGAAMLGAALHMGQGIEADQVAAMAWLIVGSRRHSTLVRGFFARVQTGLSTAERAQAEAMALRLAQGSAEAP